MRWYQLVWFLPWVLCGSMKIIGVSCLFVERKAERTGVMLAPTPLRLLKEVKHSDTCTME